MEENNLLGQYMPISEDEHGAYILMTLLLEENLSNGEYSESCLERHPNQRYQNYQTGNYKLVQHVCGWLRSL